MNKSPFLLEPPDSSESLRQIAGDEGYLSRNYLLLTVSSCVIAPLGLLENSVAVIIGAMIIAPLTGPIQAFAYAALDGEGTMIRRSLLTAAAGTLVAIGMSTLLGIAIAVPSYGSEVAARTRPNLSSRSSTRAAATPACAR